MEHIITWLQQLAQQVPVTLFVFIAALVEEIIAPIPSPLVMMLAGSIAESQRQPIIFLFWLSLVGALSKTFGSYIVYLVADKAEDLVIDKFGKLLGVSKKDTEGLGAFFSKGRRDDIGIFLLRAIPLMPTAPVSVIAGLIKINLKTYLLSTFAGLLIRSFIYMYLGYVSFGNLESLSRGFDSLEKIGYFILSIFGGVVLLWMYRKRQKGSLLEVVERWLDKKDKKN